MTALIISISVIEVLSTFIFVIYMGKKADEMDKNRKTIVVGVMKDVIMSWFSDRNFFGLIMSVIVTIAVIPGIVFLLLFEIIVWLICLIASIWDLGRRRK